MCQSSRRSLDILVLDCIHNKFTRPSPACRITFRMASKICTNVGLKATRTIPQTQVMCCLHALICFPIARKCLKTHISTKSTRNQIHVQREFRGCNMLYAMEYRFMRRWVITPQDAVKKIRTINTQASNKHPTGVCQS